MYRISKIALLAVMLGLVAGVWLPSQAHAQVVYTYSPPPPVVSYYPPPVTVVTPIVAQPTISYYAPAPTISYYAPPPPVAYAPPTTITYSYYPPALPQVTTVYAQPAPVYAPTTVVTPGAVTTRSYLGLGIFRPLGVNRETYVYPGTRSTYYAPVYP